MPWQTDRNRHLDNASAREVREKTEAARKHSARLLYEGGVPLQDIATRAKCGLPTLKKWAAEGGWKREKP